MIELLTDQHVAASIAIIFVLGPAGKRLRTFAGYLAAAPDF
jgi:hypothetical protein